MQSIGLPGWHAEKPDTRPISKLCAGAKNGWSGSVYICINMYICGRFKLKFSTGQSRLKAGQSDTKPDTWQP